MNDRKPVLTGGCQCGAVRYALYAQPERVHLCHCRMCQKAVGGPFAYLAPVRQADLAWTRGTPQTFRSSSLAYRDYCAACGTPLGFRYRHKAWIAVTGGSLDRPDLAPPTSQTGIEARAAWWSDATALPGSPTGTGDTEGRLKTMVGFQHPDHDTQAGWKPPQAG